MIVAVSVFELHLPQARSLKEKRRVIKGLTDRIHGRYRVSIAETDFHDLHQRAEISIAAVHTSQHQMEKLMDGLRTQIDQVQEAVLTSWQPEYLEGIR